MNNILKNLITEQTNKYSKNLDTLSTCEIVKIINNEDKKIAFAVEKECETISYAIDKMTERFMVGGRIIYIGAGTSGRLGLLDSVELIPTFSLPPDRTIGLIAGSEIAFGKAIEGAEDNTEKAIEDLNNIQLSEKDVLIAIAASGRTPYTLEAIKYANQIGSLTISLTCNHGSIMGKYANIDIAIDVGSEIINGSTRMKSGTAQKMVLNMLSTGTMIKSGYVFDNYMVYLKATNQKLRERAKQIVMQICQIDDHKSTDLLDATQYNIPIAVIMYKKNCDFSTAKRILTESNGNLRACIHY